MILPKILYYRNIPIVLIYYFSWNNDSNIWIEIDFKRQSQTCIYLLWNILSKVINGFFGNELKRKCSEKDNEYVARCKTIISATAIVMWRLTGNKRDNVKTYIYLNHGINNVPVLG